MAEGIALEAMRMVLRWLPVAVAEGDHLEARGHMLVAASMGATAFQKGLGSIHSVSHVVGALYGTHHGLTNAVILPYGLAHNARVLQARIPTLCRALEIEGDDCQTLLERLRQFCAGLGIPATLSELGIDCADATEVGQRAFRDPSTPTNAGPVSAADLEALFRDAVSGRLPRSVQP
jgi:alcohol dehydrogenase class IV